MKNIEDIQLQVNKPQSYRMNILLQDYSLPASVEDYQKSSSNFNLTFFLFFLFGNQTSNLRYFCYGGHHKILKTMRKTS